jgi:hypothetical protein
VQTACPKWDKTLIPLFISVYISKAFFENVPIWQLSAGIFTPAKKGQQYFNLPAL